MPVFNLFKRNTSAKDFENARSENRKTIGANKSSHDLSKLQGDISSFDNKSQHVGSSSLDESSSTTQSSVAAMAVLSKYSNTSGKKNQEKMPTPEEIMVLFEKLLKYHGITPTDKRHKIMMMKPLEEKWKLIKIMEQTKKEAEKLHTVKDTPEYITHRLKEEPTVGTVTELISLLKSAKSEDWIKKFLELRGLECLFQILMDSCDQQIQEQGGTLREEFSDDEDAKDEKEEEEEDEEDELLEEQDEAATPNNPNTPQEPQVVETKKIKAIIPPKKNEKDPYDALQSECVKALRTLMNTNVGLHAFLSNKEKSVLAITKILDSRNTRTKTQIFFLLATICRFEDGFWIALDSMNKYKLNRKERARFQTLVRLLKKKVEISEENVLLKVSLIVFINALINSPQDIQLKKQLKKEFVDLKMIDISERLKAMDLDDTLTMQLSIFEEEVQDIEDIEEDEEDVDIDSLEDPMQILKLIRVQLSGSEAFDYFVKILQYFLIVSGKSNEKEKSKNMNTLLNMIKKAVAFNEDGGVEEVSVRELQLADRVETQQRKITQLETRFLKLAEMLKNGKIDEKVIEKFISLTSKETKQSFQKSIENMDPNDLQEEFLKDAEEFLVKVKPKNGIDIETVQAPDELKKHMKKLETELKFMTYKAKQLEKQLQSGGGGGSGSGGDSSSNTNNNNNTTDTTSNTNNSSTTTDVPNPPMGGVTSTDSSIPSVPPLPGMGGQDALVPPPPGMGGIPMPPGMGGIPMVPGMGAVPAGYVPPKLPTYKSTTAMKGVFWNKVANNQLKDSIWIKKDIVNGLEAIELEQSELEKLFAKKESIVLEATTAKKPEKVTLIDPKKAQNSAIVLGSMRLEHDQIKHAILRMNEGVLAPENVKALKDMVPTPDERQALADYHDDFNNLGTTEQFLTKIMDIPRLEERLECWLIKSRFPASVASIEPDIESVINSCKQLQQSKKLQKILQVILAIGNFINGNKKAVHGFQLNALSKLKDTKATGAKMNMLDYIVQFLEKHHPEVMNFHEELAALQAAERVSIQGINAELSEMKAGVNFVGREIEKSDMNNEQDRFREVMIDFLDYASEKVENFESQMKEMQNQIEKLQVFFAEDPKKFTPESFFATMNAFISDFKFAYSEILRKREIERKKLEKEAKDKERQQKVASSRKKKEEQGEQGISRKPRANGNASNGETQDTHRSSIGEDQGDSSQTLSGGSGEEKGVLDKTLDSLIDGSGFKKGVSANKKKKAAAQSAVNLIQKLEIEKINESSDKDGGDRVNSVSSTPRDSLASPVAESATTPSEDQVMMRPRSGASKAPSKRRLKQGGDDL
ncbi:hypothetical protein FDP41_010637 [Naegleria fowleri]|uniref:FH2 domain-containing protein n=1 Tax=Naegleria fowleri TaxID=5763 RepID=A0A6A5C9D3_NAEFO|nr:uncharacterized protein FDP41_010637 [Naegleria fowleri]KAF0983572.1 hypothetical protein FDP41_010637 [Naegleria fowleri]